jgi:hypothetical protein
MMSRKSLSLFLALGMVYGSSAFAIKFTKSEFHLTATAGQAFTLDLNTLVTDVSHSGSVSWSADGLSKWMTLDTSTGMLTGTPTDQDISADTFSIFAVQGNSADQATVFLNIESTDSETPNKPVWFSDAITINACVGQAIASEDFADDIMVSNPGMALPIPQPEFSLVNAPAWVVPVSKENGSFYLTGVPQVAGDATFTTRACVKSTCTDEPTIIKVTNCQ